MRSFVGNIDTPDPRPKDPATRLIARKRRPICVRPIHTCVHLPSHIIAAIKNALLPNSTRNRGRSHAISHRHGAAAIAILFCPLLLL